ncbi:hypothetical protein [Mesorhizobium sp.]|uniref:hypothetical protein n=1 Tax=Mesorhizobium sp. TaxID=1871066 RepID=UPI00257B15FE|nr:hypothetical protein [Mesorhizobium sp.]
MAETQIEWTDPHLESPPRMLDHRRLHQIAAAREMDHARDRVLAAFRKPYPSFSVILEK